MQCLDPIFARRFDVFNKNLILSERPLQFCNFRDYILGFSSFPCERPRQHSNIEVVEMLKSGEYYLFPCRKCVNCNLNRSREWAIRNSFEAKDHNDKFFLTLTYDNFGIEHTKTNYGLYSLKVADVQNFLKRLRKKSKTPLRFYLAGEYGTTTFRPHYHLLIYGLHLDDLEFLYIRNGFKYYISKTISELWSYGFHIITDFTDYTSMYTARYCTKKMGTHKALIADIIPGYYDTYRDVKVRDKVIYKVQPEFNTMSRRPGIATNYFINNKNDIYKNDIFLFHINDKTLRLKPLKFFDRLYDFDNAFHMNFIKENRKEFSKEHNFFEELQTDLSYAEYLEMEERKAKDKIKNKRKEQFYESTKT